MGMKIYYEDGTYAEIKSPKYTKKEKKEVFYGKGKIKPIKVKFGKWKK